MKRLIQIKTPMIQIRQQAIQNGMTTLNQDGIEKILKGGCDLLQVRTDKGIEFDQPVSRRAVAPEKPHIGFWPDQFRRQGKSPTPSVP